MIVNKLSQPCLHQVEVQLVCEQKMILTNNVLRADDGFISAKDLEFSMGRGADVKQMIAAADKNGDGKVMPCLMWARDSAGACWHQVLTAGL